MSFWDDLTINLSIACDNLRETAIGKKILDGIVDSMDEAERKLDRIDQKVNVLLMDDVATEGKKRGYTKAAAEYEAVFKQLEEEYHRTERVLSEKKSSHDEQFQALVNQLEYLEQKRTGLEKQVERNARTVANHYGISPSTIMRSIGRSDIAINIHGPSIFDKIYSHKEKALREAEEAGYQEAKEQFIRKMNRMQKSLDSLIAKGEGEISKMAELIKKALLLIAEEKTKIAELRILLQGGE